MAIDLDESMDTAEEILDPNTVEEKTKALEQLWNEIESTVLSDKIIEYGMIVDGYIQARARTMKFWLKWLAQGMRQGVIYARRMAMVAAAKFALDWLRADLLPPLPGKLDPEAETDNATLMLKKAASRVVELGSRIKPTSSVEEIAKLIDLKKAASTPLSAMLLGVYVRTYTSNAPNPALATSGQRLVVMGNLGSGKSTITFWSIAVALRLLGASWHTIMNYMRHYMVSTIKDYITTIHVINTYAIDNGIVAPAIVFDDAAVLLSKYSAWSRTASKKELLIATALTRQLQISREGIALLIFNTSDISVLAKGIRDTMDMGFIGLDVRSMWRTYTNWILSGESIVVDYAFDDWKSRRVRRLLRKLKFGLIADMTAAVIPPLYMPSEMYMELQANKVNTRRELSLKIAELGKEIENEESEMEERVVQEEEPL